MVNEDILNYLKDGLRRGFSLRVLKDELIKNKFNLNEVNEAADLLSEDFSLKQPYKNDKQTTPNFDEKNNTKPLSSSSQPKLGVFRKIKETLVHPTRLFELTQGENVWDLFKYWFVLSIIPLIIFMIFLGVFSTFAIGSSPKLIDKMFPAFVGASSLSILGLFFGLIFVFFYIISPILLIISSWIFYLILKLFRGQGSFADTLRVGVYSMTPSLVLVFLPFVQVWSLVLVLIGISVTHKISKGRAIVSWIIYLGLIGLILTGLSFLLSLILINP